MTRQGFLQHLRSIENEYLTAALSVRRLRATARGDHSLLRNEGLTVGDLEACQGNLESTYVIRLFAEFEAPLRLYWRDARRRASWETINARTLIDNVAAYQYVPESVRDSVHEVRDFRNSLVHQSAEMGIAALTFAQCRSSLCRFLSFLPFAW